MLTADSTPSNLTLYLPPVINNTSPVGMDIVDNHFDNNDPSWEYALVDTEHGPMLSMKNKKPRSIDLSIITLSNQIIDIMNPLVNETVLIPKYKVTHNINTSGAYLRTGYSQFEQRLFRCRFLVRNHRFIGRHWWSSDP